MYLGSFHSHRARLPIHHELIQPHASQDFIHVDLASYRYMYNVQHTGTGTLARPRSRSTTNSYVAPVVECVGIFFGDYFILFALEWLRLGC